MTTLVVHPAVRPLSGSVPVPADADIACRAFVLGALGQGASRISGFTSVEGTEAIVGALRALGVAIEERSKTERVVAGGTLRGLRAPGAPIDCAGSVDAVHVLCGLLAPQPFRSTLTGQGRVSNADLSRVAAPLRLRGAQIAAPRDAGPRDRRGEGELFAPVTIGPLPEGRAMSPLEYESPEADAAVKTVALLSGLYAEGPTIFREPTVSCDHTERLLESLGVPVRTVGPLILLDPAKWDGQIPAFEMKLPGDPSAAAALLAAAQMVDGSSVTVRDVGTNPTRSGFLELARHMGAGLRTEPQGESHGEPVATLHAWCAPLRATAIGGETLRRTGSDLPIACALAARADGTTRIREDVDAGASGGGQGAGLHRQALAVLRAFGVSCAESAGGLEVSGGPAPLSPANVDCAGEPAIAMMAAVLALAGRAPSRIQGAGCLAATYPKFVATLRALGARVDVGV